MKKLITTFWAIWTLLQRGNGIAIKGNGQNNKSILRAREIIGQTVITSRDRSGKGIKPNGIKTIRVNSIGGITAKILNGTTIINGTTLKIISKQIDGTTALIGINLNINKKWLAQELMEK